MVRPFTDKQIELVTTFADQAVIAIENARLFDEVQARTRELTESLEQQTATARGARGHQHARPVDLQPVLDTMLANAARGCASAKLGNLFARGRRIPLVAQHGAIAGIRESAGNAIRSRRPRADRCSIASLDQAGCSHRRCRWPIRNFTVTSDGRQKLAASGRCSASRCCGKVTPIGVDRHLRAGGAARSPTTDRAGHDLRRPGRDRHREHAPAQRTAARPRIRCSSRPPPPTCSRSSAARPSICRRCSTR